MIDLVNYKTIIFHHIPKTAGTTLYNIFDTQFFGKIHTVSGNQLDHEKSINEIVNASEDFKNSIDLIKGHRLYGIDKHFPQPCAYITVVRDPARRFISSYYQMLKVKPELPERIDFIQSKLSLEDYVERGDIYFGYNSQIKSFLNLVDPKLEITKEHLDFAIKIAKEEFLLVGLTERFYETVVLLNQIRGVKITHFSNRNIGLNYNSAEISLDLIKRYNELNQMDRKFFLEMEKLFQEKIDSTYNFDKKIIDFRKRNERRNKYYRFRNDLMKPIRGVRRFFKS